MAAAAISLSPKHAGEAIVDVQSPLSFIVGFAAGIFGVDPSMATLTFVGAKIVDQSLSKGSRAVFRRDSGQSLANQLADVLINFAGVQCGTLLRKRLEAEQATAGLGRLQFQPYVGFNATLTPNGLHR